MIEYILKEISELVNDSKLYQGKKVKVIGKVINPLSHDLILYYNYDLLCYDDDIFTTTVGSLFHQSFILEVRGPAGLFWDSELEEKLNKAFKLQLPLSIKGEYRLPQDHINGAHIWIHQAEIISGGELSLTNDGEGKLSITDTGKLSLFKK